MLESCTTIVGACLEQTTWLRRNLAVREEEPAVTPDREDKCKFDLFVHVADIKTVKLVYLTNNYKKIN